jgi:histidinol-phosphate aminotransferase
MSAIAAKNSLSADNVLLGAGSTQVIDTVVQLAAQQKGSFILARPTFGRWANAAEQAGLQKIELPLTEDKRHDLPAMLRAIKPDTRLVYICNPNNPTGTICAYDALLAFVAEATRHCLVMVDEAYLDYTDQQSLCGLVKTNKNLVVVKTFSKIYGLAGARIGYALAHPETIERLQQLQSGADIGISAVSLAAATAALQDNDFVSRSAAQNEHCRTTTIDALERAGLPCIPSHTNFIYFSLAHYKEDLFERLKQHHIQGTELFEQAGKWTRITVGTSSEMQRFIAAVQ